MSIQKYRWILPAPVPSEINDQLRNYSPTMRSILYQRGITTGRGAREFISTDPPTFSSSQSLTDLPRAADLVLTSVHKRKKIAVYGDYDADGVTATALMVDGLNSLDAKVLPFLPHRIEDGYGLSSRAVEEMIAEDFSLLITVDCGIRAVDQAALAKQSGMNVIITDHHLPGELLPEADAIINPNQRGDVYPNKNLAGVGVAYKLLKKIAEAEPEACADDALDLVAIGTVADIVPLTGENRWLVSRGLDRINRTRRQGLRSLIAAAGLTPGTVQAADISYQISPRINSSGRMASAELALKLLLSDNIQEAGHLAQKLEILNQRRKAETRSTVKKAEALALQEKELPPVLFAFDESFHPGVIGIAASYLADRYFRPAIVGSRKDDLITASCRSIPDYNIIEALSSYQHLFDRYGGHASAAGFSISVQHLNQLIESLSASAAESLEAIPSKPEIKVDAEVELGDLKSQLLEELSLLEPTGSQNPQAVFLSKDVKIIKKRVVGKNKSHLKLVISDGSRRFDAIGFGLGHLTNDLPQSVDLVFAFEKNIYRNRMSLQLRIHDLRPAAE